MATKKEWKDYVKALREWVKAMAAWVKEQGENKSATDEFSPGTNPPSPPPPPPLP